MIDNCELWVEKYRPKTLDDYVIDDNIRSYFKDMISKKALQSMTFAGTCGSGKTTLAKVLCNELNAEVLFVKCATDGTLDVLRTRITEFCNAMTMDGRIKVVLLDEIDSASSSSVNNFQLGLRTVIEQAQDDTRFILTCNYSAKVVDAVLSRCPIIPLKFGKKDLLQRVKFILDSEKIEYDKESLRAFIEESFGFYPDIRRIVNYLQFCCGSGKLVVQLNNVVESGKRDFLKELVSLAVAEKDLLKVRQFYMKNKDAVADYVAFGSDLFNYVVDSNIIDIDGVLKLTDMLYQLNVVIDKEVGLFGMVTAISKYAKVTA